MFLFESVDFINCMFFRHDDDIIIETCCQNSLQSSDGSTHSYLGPLEFCNFSERIKTMKDSSTAEPKIFMGKQLIFFRNS